MYGHFYSLSASLWAFEICVYLSPSDILTLRLLSKEANTFSLEHLIPRLLSHLQERLASLESSIDEEKKVSFAGFREVLGSLQQEWVESLPQFRSALAEVLSFPNPPAVVYSVCSDLVRLITNSTEPLPWTECKSVLKRPLALTHVLEATLDESVVEAVEKSAATTPLDMVRAVSKSAHSLMCANLSLLNRNKIRARDDVQSFLRYEEAAGTLQKRIAMFAKAANGRRLNS